MTVANGTSFHDSSLVAINHRGDDILLSFENVYVDGTLRFAELGLTGVIGITCDSEPIEKIEIIYDDGEVLKLSSTDNELLMLITWTDFKRDIDQTHSYQVICKSIAINIGPVSPDNPVVN
jgi:hypothetical protein